MGTFWEAFFVWRGRMAVTWDFRGVSKSWGKAFGFFEKKATAGVN